MSRRVFTVDEAAAIRAIALAAVRDEARKRGARLIREKRRVDAQLADRRKGRPADE
jgi:hypothetical protein